MSNYIDAMNGKHTDGSEYDEVGMEAYEITIDYTVVFRTTVKADTPEKAKEIAEREAYQDSWSSGGTWGGCEIIECELEEEEDVLS